MGYTIQEGWYWTNTYAYSMGALYAHTDLRGQIIQGDFQRRGTEGYGKGLFQAYRISLVVPGLSFFSIGAGVWAGHGGSG